MRNAPWSFRELTAVAIFASVVGICHRAAEYTADHASAGARLPASVTESEQDNFEGSVMHGSDVLGVVASASNTGFSALSVKQSADTNVPALQRITEFAADASACKHPKAELEANPKLHFRCLKHLMSQTQAKLFAHVKAKAKQEPRRYGSLRDLKQVATQRCKAGRGFSEHEIQLIDELVEGAEATGKKKKIEGGLPNSQRPDLGVAIYRKSKSHGKTSLKPYMFWGERDFFALVTTAMAEARSITLNREHVEEPTVLAHMMVAMKAMKNNMAAEVFPRDMFRLVTHSNLYQPWFAGNAITPCMIAGINEGGSTLDFDRALYAYVAFIHPKTKFHGMTQQTRYFAANGKPFSSRYISSRPADITVEFPLVFSKDKKPQKVRINGYRGTKNIYWDNLQVPKQNRNF